MRRLAAARAAQLDLGAMFAPTAAAPASKFDAAVIGAGSGGIAFAKEAAALGASVFVADFVRPSPRGASWGPGGACVNVGCIPKKMFQHAAVYGRQETWHELTTRVSAHVRSLSFGYRAALQEAGVHLELAEAAVAADGSGVRLVADGRVVEAEHVVVATGARPAYPADVPGAVELGVTSDDLWTLPEAPGRTLVVGGGYIAVECASILAGLGHPTTLAARSTLLRDFDGDAVARLEAALQPHVRVLKGRAPTAVLPGLRCLGLGVDDEQFDTVVFATGRAPATAGLGPLEGAHLIGDARPGALQLTPVAIAEGRRLARSLFGDSSSSDLGPVPTAVYATPVELASVGALAGPGDDEYHIAFRPPAGVPEADCYIKVVVSPADDVVRGVHIVAPGASEMVQGLAVALRAGATKADLDATLGIHPTISEQMTMATVTKASGLAFERTGC